MVEILKICPTVAVDVFTGRKIFSLPVKPILDVAIFVIDVGVPYRLFVKFPPVGSYDV